MILKSGIIFFVMTVLITVCIGQDSTITGELTIIINGFENEEGMARISLSDSKEDYEAEDQSFRSNETKIADSKAVWSVSDLHFGEYAIKVYHDEDDDDELDTNFLGVPSEDYGFSNDARGSFGPASWEEAKFMFNSPIDTVVITVE